MSFEGLLERGGERLEGRELIVGFVGMELVVGFVGMIKMIVGFVMMVEMIVGLVGMMNKMTVGFVVVVEMIVRVVVVKMIVIVGFVMLVKMIGGVVVMVMVKKIVGFVGMINVVAFVQMNIVDFEGKKKIVSEMIKTIDLGREKFLVFGLLERIDFGEMCFETLRMMKPFDFVEVRLIDLVVQVVEEEQGEKSIFWLVKMIDRGWLERNFEEMIFGMKRPFDFLEVSLDGFDQLQNPEGKRVAVRFDQTTLLKKEQRIERDNQKEKILHFEKFSTMLENEPPFFSKLLEKCQGTNLLLKPQFSSQKESFGCLIFVLDKKEITVDCEREYETVWLKIRELGGTCKKSRILKTGEELRL